MYVKTNIPLHIYTATLAIYRSTNLPLTKHILSTLLSRHDFFYIQLLRHCHIRPSHRNQ